MPVLLQVDKEEAKTGCELRREDQQHLSGTRALRGRQAGPLVVYECICTYGIGYTQTRHRRG